MLPDDKVKSSEDTAMLPLSRVLMDTTKPQGVNSIKGSSKENSRSQAAVKSSNTLKQQKQQKKRSSSSHVCEPRSKLLKVKRETTEAAWTESLFISEQLHVGRDAAEGASSVDCREQDKQPSSIACSSAASSTSSVTEDGQHETVSLHKNQNKSLPQNSLVSTKLLSEEITAVDSNSTEVLTLPAASGETLLKRDGATTVIIIDKCQSNATTSENTCLVKSPPAVHRTSLTHVHGSAPTSLPSTAVQTVRTTLSMSLPSAVTRSFPSSTSKATFSLPVHAATAASRAVTSTTSVHVRPASNVYKMPTATGGQILVTRSVTGTSAQQHQQQHCVGASSAVYHICSQSQSLSLQSSSQSSSLGSSGLLPTCKSEVVRPPNTKPILLVRGKQVMPRSSVQQSSSSSPSDHYVRQLRSAVSVSTAQRCSTSAGAVQRQTLLPVTTDSRLVSRTVLTRPAPSPQQPVRIRISATELGNTADPTAMMDHVRGILSKTNAISPGAQIRIRYVQPPTTSSQPQTAQSHTSTSSTRVFQLDGTADSDDETTDVEHSGSTRPTTTGVTGIDGCRTGRTRRRSKTAGVDETETTPESHVR